MPWNWANLGLAVNDLVDISAAAQANCNFEELLNNIAEILSWQGLSEFGTRNFIGLFTDFY